MNSTTINSAIKTRDRKLKMKKKNLVATKCLIYLQKKYALKSSKHFSLKSTASKQNNMITICLEHQNKGKPYIFTHDPKFINLFDI